MRHVAGGAGAGNRHHANLFKEITQREPAPVMIKPADGVGPATDPGKVDPPKHIPDRLAVGTGTMRARGVIPNAIKQVVPAGGS